VTNTDTMWPARRARICGVVYVTYLAAIEVAWIAIDRRPAVCRAALLLCSASYLLLSLLFYGLFKPVSKRVSLEAALFGVVGSALGILHLFGIASQVRTIPFLGGFAILVGYLIVRSAFLPPVLGWLMMLCGVGWLAYLSPSIAKFSHGRMSDFSFAVEGLLAVWLLVKGVDVLRWQEQAGDINSLENHLGRE
jgi:hypothetical protein